MSVRPFVCSRKVFEELSCERRTGLHVGLFVQLRHGIVSHSVELCRACPPKTNSENNEEGGASGFAVRRETNRPTQEGFAMSPQYSLRLEWQPGRSCAFRLTDSSSMCIYAAASPLHSEDAFPDLCAIHLHLIYEVFQTIPLVFTVGIQ